MRKVIWFTPDGYKHCSMIRDTDPDESATMGIPCEPPDIHQIDWEAVKRDLHNLLVDRGLIGMADINRSPEHLKSAANCVLYRRIVALYTKTPVTEVSNV